MKTGLSVFAWEVSAALLACSAAAGFAEETIHSASSIFAADGRIPASIEEMLPAHARLGLERSDWARLSSSTASRSTSGMSLQGQVSSDVDATFADVYRRLEERDDLFAPRPSSNRFVRATDAIFTPAPIKLGSTYISFTPVTAWKKRNPLCLLNPLVFNISW